MGLLIGSCVLVTLIVGFAAGYLCSRHFRADPYSNVSLHTNHQLNRLVNIITRGFECEKVTVFTQFPYFL